MAVAALGLRLASPSDFSPDRFRTVWLDILFATLLTFLSPNLPAYFLLLATYATIRGFQSNGDPNQRISIFLVLLLTSPGLTWTPGGGDSFNALIQLDPPRVLILALLLPLIFSPPAAEFPRKPFAALDIAVFLYPIWTIAGSSGEYSATHIFRLSLYAIVDVIIPYFAISRHIHNPAAVRFLGQAVLASVFFLSAIAIFESFKRWQLYVDLQGHYGVTWQLTRTLFRGDLLRAQAVTPQPIVLAMDMVFAMGWFFMAKTSASSARTWLTLGAFVLALFLTGSRGPMMGAAVLMAVIYAGKSASPRVFARISTIFLVSAFVVMMMGWLDDIAQFIKTAFNMSAGESNSIDYRRELFLTSVELIKQSPWTGVPNFAAYMQNLKQGEGIIDMVNAYLHISLSHGLIGTVLYLSPPLLAFHATLRTMQYADAEYRQVFVGAIALMTGLLLILVTTSIFYIIPQLVVCLYAVPAGLIATAKSEFQRNGINPRAVSVQQ